MDLLLDANFLVLPFQFNVEIFDEFERLSGGEFQAYTLERTYHEARDLEEGSYRQLVERLVEVKDITLLNTPADKPVDSQLLEMAQDGFVVCTNDTELRNRLDHQALPHIFLRQKNHLEGKNLRQGDGELPGF
jgi:rRNA-processing protein FCF1